MKGSKLIGVPNTNNISAVEKFFLKVQRKQHALAWKQIGNIYLNTVSTQCARLGKFLWITLNISVPRRKGKSNKLQTCNITEVANALST